VDEGGAPADARGSGSWTCRAAPRAEPTDQISADVHECDGRELRTRAVSPPTPRRARPV